MNGRTRRGIRSRLGALLLVAALALGASGAAQAADQVVAVVHPSNPVESISLKQLRLLYGTYKRTWGNGEPVQLILPPGEDPALAFLVDVVFKKQSMDDLSRYYVKAIFQQKISKAPPQLTRLQALATVRKEPGAIVLLDRASVDDAEGLRILPIER